MKKVCLLIAVVLLWGTTANASIWTYNYPNAIVNSNDAVVKRSTLYDIDVVQGSTTKDCYVMFDKNQAENVNGNLAKDPDHHWTNFSVDGGSVQIKIKRLDGKALTSATVYPLKKGYKATISNNIATITIPSGVSKLQLYVELNGLKAQPLFVFVDPKETDVPNMNASDVTVINTSDNITTVKNKLNNSTTYKYFAPGIHKWGTKTGSNYDGYMLPVKEGKKIYLPGGAYVIGSFSGNNAGNWKVYGRGIVSGAGLDELPTSQYIPWSAIHHSGNKKGMEVEGIVSMCPPHFGITIRGECDIDNVKMTSWWYSTDGTITGNNSTVNNCFFKVNDDGIKVYGDNCTHDNNTMYHQINGAPFQFSWTGQKAKNTVSTNTYIVNSVYKNKLDGRSNTAVVNCVDAKEGQTIENHVFDGIYIDNGCHRLLGLNATKGTLKNITLKNVEIRSGDKSKPQLGYSYLDNGTFSNINLCNVYVDGQLITGLDNNADKPAQGKLFFKGQSNKLSFCDNNGGGTETCGLGDQPEAQVSSTNADCEINNGTITFTFPDNSGRTGIEFSIDGGLTYLPQVADNSGSTTVNNLVKGTYSVFARWGNDECATNLGTVTINEVGCESQTCGVSDQPEAQVTSNDADCQTNNGMITFTFPDNTGRTGIEFSIDGGATYLPQVADNSGSTTINNLSKGTYSVFSRWGNNDCPTDLGTVTINEVGCVTAPTDINDLMAIVTACPSVKLTWSDVAGETAYRVRRKKQGETTYQNLTDVAADATTYTDNTAQNNVTYIYMVRPVVNGVAVKISNIATVTPICIIDTDGDGIPDDQDECPNDATNTCNDGDPVNINDLTATINANCKVQLNWGDVPGETAYRVRRKKQGEASYQNITDVNANVTSYVDNSAQSGITYVYQVRPVVDGKAVKVSNTPTINVNCSTIAKLSDETQQIPKVFPSPANEYIIIADAKVGDKIIIASVSGVLYERIVRKDLSVDVSTLKGGIYYVLLNGNTYKFKKQ